MFKFIKVWLRNRKVKKLQEELKACNRKIYFLEAEVERYREMFDTALARNDAESVQYFRGEKSSLVSDLILYRMKRGDIWGELLRLLQD